MAQQVEALAVLAEDGKLSSQHPHGSSRPSGTPVSGFQRPLLAYLGTASL